jgi:AcrR family transcriptional regulator
VSERASRRRPGRPPAEESVGRADAIVDVARHQFAHKGFDATTLSGVAADAGLSLAALYHYVNDKFELYEMVFHATLTGTWEGIGKQVSELEPSPLLAERFEGLLEAIKGGAAYEDVNGFLAAAPLEVRRHPELAHLLEERDRVRLEVLRLVVEPVYYQGALARFGSLDQATRAIEILFSGWGMENFFKPEQADQLAPAVLELARIVDAAGTPAKPRKASTRSRTKKS